MHVAKALGRTFYFTGAVDNVFKLNGYMDANGNYVRTSFREAYEWGGVFLFDEIDASTRRPCGFQCRACQRASRFPGWFG